MSPCPARSRPSGGGVVRAVLVGLLISAIAALPSTPATAQEQCGTEGAAPPTAVPWQLRQLDPGAVWHVSRGSGVTVAVVDSGVSDDHPVLAGRVDPGLDLVPPGGGTGHCDQEGHGTIVAGLIAGRDDTGVRFSGVAPDATILPIRVLADERTSDADFPDRVATAIRSAVDLGADVVNLSLETLDTRPLRAAVRYAEQHEVVLVAAAGNIDEGGVRGPAYPAAYPEVLAVAAVGEAGQRLETSWTAGYIDVAAPGQGIVGPAPAGDGWSYRPEGGTSYAAAYVSGTVALVRGYHPELSAAAVRERIRQTAVRPAGGPDAAVGHGVISPYRAVTVILGGRPGPTRAGLVATPAPPDPRAGDRLVAGWTAVGGGLLAAALLLSRPVLRRGRERGWRPARAGSDRRVRGRPRPSG